MSTCCFIGHREICVSEEIKLKLRTAIEEVIKEGVDVFLFGSRSQFDSLCLKTVNEIHDLYPYIRRIYVRAEYPRIDRQYYEYLLSLYDDTYFPEAVKQSGKNVYILRNQVMIDNSEVVIIYYNENCSNFHSGTYHAIKYATIEEEKDFELIRRVKRISIIRDKLERGYNCVKHCGVRPVGS